MSTQPAKSPPVPVWKGFLFGGIACCVAETLTFPIDTVKTRLQLQGELGATRQYNGMIDALRKIAADEGLSGWFKGLSPALLRQATYGTIRYGAYEPIKAMLASPGETEKSFPVWKKVRLQADTGKGGARYKGLGDAFVSIVKSEGILGLYRGVGPTSARASVGAASELATYDEIKHQLVSRGIVSSGSSLSGHVLASLAAGAISTVAINPFDVAKSRMMNQKVDPLTRKGMLYSNMGDCFVKTVSKEGVFALWKGCFASYLRVGPRVLVIFVIMEQLKARF